MLVADVFRQHVLRRQRLAEIVRQRGEPDDRIARREPRGHVAHQFDVHAGVDFRVVFRALRHAVQRIDFRQHDGQRTAIAQGAQEGRRRRRRERAHQFLPHAFGDEFGHSPDGHDLAHQRHRFRRDGEPEIGGSAP